jgi:hypothetical protein
MPASIHHACPSCRSCHELVLFSADEFSWGDDYEYVCPSTAELVCVQIADSGMPTSVKAENAVSVRRIGSPG